MDDKNHLGSYARCCRCNKWYEQLRAINDMKDLGRELKALDALKSSGLWMIRTTRGPDL